MHDSCRRHGPGAPRGPRTWCPSSASVCDEEDRPIRLFAAEGIEKPFYHDDFTPLDNIPANEFFTADDWPFDLWGPASQSDQ